MAWDPKEVVANIEAGPYTIGVGTAGSEVSIGEIDALQLIAGLELNPIYGGSHFGPATIVDDGVKGVVVGAVFVLKQYDTEALNRCFPLSTITTGATNKMLTLDLGLIVGRMMKDSAARVRLHKLSVTALTDEYSDIIFPAGVVIPVGDAYNIDGSEANMQPCIIRGYPDANDYVIQWSKDQT